MNEKNREEQAAEARMAEMLSAALAEELGDMPKVSITVEELEALERADRQQRRKRRLCYFSMAAAVFFICVVALYALWPETAVPVSADKNTEQRVEEGNGEIIINEGDGTGQEGITIIDESNENNCAEWRDTVPGLAVPQYIPSGYSFEGLHIEIYVDDGFSAQYVYRKSDLELCVLQRKHETKGDKTRNINGDVESFQTKLGEAYLSKDKNGIYTGIVHINDGYIKLAGTKSQEESIKVLNGLKVPQGE